MNDDPGGQFSQEQIIQLILDSVLIGGSLFLCWCAAAAYGLVSAPPFIFDGVSSQTLEEKRMTILVIAGIAVLDYPALLFISARQARGELQVTADNSPQKLRLVFTSAVLLYIIVLYFILR
jgi:hypothetical protein